MLPSAHQLLSGLEFLARRFGVSSPSPAAVLAALDEARTLCEGSEADATAALFFALARRARGLGALCWTGPAVVANALAQQQGLPTIPHGDLRSLGLAIAQRGHTYEEVRDWFRRRQQRDA